MANLAIKGHPTRGKEVIEILEMLGGKNGVNHDGSYNRGFYFLDTTNIICHGYGTGKLVGMDSYTLEEFLEKYPYKVGDNVTYYIGTILTKETRTIIRMQWDSDKCRILYYFDNFDVVEVEAILYRTECKIEQPKQKRIKNINSKNYNTATIKYIQENGSRDMELIIPYNQEIVNIDGRYILRDKKPQYPKTYDECCNILGIEDRENGYCGYEYELLGEFQKLYICRNAYWKIAGEQMGLGKPWKPDWTNFKVNKFCIGVDRNITSNCNKVTGNKILAFPTEEMRDAFYDNFKELIDKCKELL